LIAIPIGLKPMPFFLFNMRIAVSKRQSLGCLGAEEIKQLMG